MPRSRMKFCITMMYSWKSNRICFVVMLWIANSFFFKVHSIHCKERERMNETEAERVRMREGESEVRIDSIVCEYKIHMESIWQKHIIVCLQMPTHIIWYEWMCFTCLTLKKAPYWDYHTRIIYAHALRMLMPTCDISNYIAIFQRVSPELF